MTIETQTQGTAPSADASAATAQPSAPASAAPAQPAAAPAQPTTLLTGEQPAEGAQPSADQTQQGASTEQPDEKKDGEQAQAQGVPEEYAEFTAPEGMTFNTEALTEFKGLAKELNLPQESAQKLADLGGKLVQKVQADQMRQIEQAQAQWASDARVDPEFGGDNLPKNMAVAKQALDAFGSPELSKLLGESGLGNHPEIIRAFYRVGNAIGQDKLIPGTTRTSNKDDARSLYPNSDHS